MFASELHRQQGFDNYTVYMLTELTVEGVVREEADETETISKWKRYLEDRGVQIINLLPVMLPDFLSLINGLYAISLI